MMFYPGHRAASCPICLGFGVVVFLIVWSAVAVALLW